VSFIYFYKIVFEFTNSTTLIFCFIVKAPVQKKSLLKVVTSICLLFCPGNFF